MAQEIDSLFPAKGELRDEVERWADLHAEEFVKQMKVLGDDLEIENVPAVKSSILEKHLDEYFTATKNKKKKFNKQFSEDITDETSKSKKERIVREISRKVDNSLSLLRGIERDRLFQKLDRQRQEDYGIREYRWVTERDAKVRLEHTENDGKKFSWDNPREKTGHPGEQHGCRCAAQPILPPEKRRTVDEVLSLDDFDDVIFLTLEEIENIDLDDLLEEFEEVEIEDVAIELALLAVPISKLGKVAKFFKPIGTVLTSSRKIKKVSKQISEGHAFNQHIHKFPSIKTKKQFAKHIENVITNPTKVKRLPRGRVGYWHEKTKTVVVHNVNDPDGGTAFKSSLRFFEKNLD